MKPAGREIFGSLSNGYINRIIELLDRQPGITILGIMRNIDYDNWHNRFREIRETLEYLRKAGYIYREHEHIWSPSRYYLMQ